VTGSTAVEGAVVVKVGGSELAREGFAAALAETIRGLAEERPCVVVHGGGPEINRLLQRLGIVPRYHQGQRITDDETLAVVEMALSGRANKELVRHLLAAGVDALGLSGIDRRLLTVEPAEAAMGRVGRVVAVRAEVLREILAAGVVPVVSPISLGPGGAFNVNADHAAGAVARALGASRLVFLTNVPGVRVDGRVAERLDAAEAGALLADGTVRDGMIPKVRAGLEALEGGVGQVSIADLEGFATGGGTTLAAEASVRPIALQDVPA
jgi:acetylglutamate kinase